MNDMLAAFQKSNNKKGQGIVEYALLLAFIVGIAMMLNGADLGNAVKGVFDDVAAVLGGGSSSNSKYAAAFSKWSKSSLDDLLDSSTEAERFAADLEGLENIGKYYIGKNVNDVAKDFGYTNENDWRINSYLTNENTDGSVVLHYWATDGSDSTELSKTKNLGATDWMQQKYDTDFAIQSNYRGVKSSNRYFFSDTMSDYSKGDSEKQIRVSFTTDASGTITGSHVWVSQQGQNNRVAVTNANGDAYSVTVP